MVTTDSSSTTTPSETERVKIKSEPSETETSEYSSHSPRCPLCPALFHAERADSQLPSQICTDRRLNYLYDTSPQRDGHLQRTNFPGHRRHVHTDPPTMDPTKRPTIVDLCIYYTYRFPHRNSQTGNSSHTPGARSGEIVARIRHHAGKYTSPGR